jgi:hypothetical protein
MLTMLVLSHIGLALLVLGYGWLLVSACRVKVGWGLAALLPPGQWLFVLLNKGKAWQALLVQGLAVAMIILPAMDMMSDPVLTTHYVNKSYSLQCCDFSKPLVVAEPLPVDPDHPPITIDNLITPEKKDAIESVVREQIRKVQALAAPVIAPAPSPKVPNRIYKCKDAKGKIMFTDNPCVGDGVAGEVLVEKPINSLPAPQRFSSDMSDEEVQDADETMRPRSGHFMCDGRTRCSQMTSCAEAMFFLRNCPGVQMDGGGDGIPCERQWCGE